MKKLSLFLVIMPYLLVMLFVLFVYAKEYAFAWAVFVLLFFSVLIEYGNHYKNQ